MRNKLKFLFAFVAIAVLPITANAQTVTSAVSRKTHGGAGNFDIPLPLTGTPGIECRMGGGTNDYTMVVTFDQTIVSVTGSPQAQVILGTGCVGSGGVCNGNVSFSGNSVTVLLTNVANAQIINVRLNGVNGSTNPVIPMARLLADATANGAVNSSDLALIISQLGQGTNATNFRSDVNPNGAINAADVALTKTNLGNGVPGFTIAPSPNTQPLSLNGPPTIDLTMTTTLTVSVGLTFSVYNSFGLSYWLEAPNALAPHLSITNVTYFVFSANQTTPNPAPFNSMVDATPGFMIETRDLGGTGSAAAGTYHITDITFSLDPATPPGTYTLQSTTRGGHVAEVTDTNFTDNAMNAAGTFTFTVLPTPTPTPCPNDIAVDALVNPPNGGGVVNGSTIMPQASFKNVGTDPQSNVMVRFMISGAGAYTYTSDKMIPSIVPNQTVTVTFDTAPTFMIDGSYQSTATVQTADCHPNNDVLNGAFQVGPPISGSFTVGSGGDYPTLTAAVQALNNSILTGPVVFNLPESPASGSDHVNTETFPIIISHNGGSSQMDTITIRPGGGTSSSPEGNVVTTIGSSASALIIIDGADWVILDGSNNSSSSRDWTLINTDPGTTSSVLWIQTSTNPVYPATHNVIKNVNLVGSGNTQTLFGVGSGSNMIGAVSFGSGNNSNTFQNCNISKTQYGIYSGGSGPITKNTGTVITQNLINTSSPDNVAIGGILVKFEDGIQITQNSIANMTRSAGVFGIGLGLGDSINNLLTLSSGADVTNATVSRNKIDNVVSSSGTGFSAAGIIAAPVTSGVTRIDNNMISRVVSQATASNATIGLFAMGGTGSTTNIYYNSVSMTGSRSAANYPSYALAIGGSNPVVDVRDNILFNTQTGTSSGKMYAIGTNSASFSNMVSDYNDLFVSGTNTFVGQTGGLGTAGTDRATLTDWRNATGRDLNSIPDNPGFLTTSNLHITNVSPVVCHATPIAGATTDIDGDARSLFHPDIGADELTAPPVVSAVSRKTHAGAGDFDIALPGVECRSGGAMHNFQIVVTFVNPTTVSSATVTTGIGSVNVTDTGSNTTTLDLMGVVNAQSVTVTMNCASDTNGNAGDVSITMGVLLGDTSGNGAVNAGDVSQTKARLGQTLGAGNFRSDVNLSGGISSSDVSIIKSNLGSAAAP